MSSVTLADCCSFYSGGTPEKNKTDYWKGTIPWFSPKDIKSFELLTAQDRISESAIKESATRLVEPGTILVVGRSGVLAHTLPVGIVRQRSAFNQDIKAIVPNSCYDPEYIALYLRAKQGLVLKDGVKRGPTVHSLIADFLEELEVPNIPLEDQRRIAARLKAQLAEVETAWQAAQTQVSESKSLVDAILRHGAVVSDIEPLVLGDVVRIDARIVDPTDPTLSLLPHVSAENISSVTGKLHHVRSAAEDGMESGKYLFDAGDVLYSKLRPYLRKATVANFAGLCSADMYPLKFDDNRIDPEYIRTVLVSDAFTAYANELSARSRMPKLNREQLLAYKFGLPSIDKQRRIVHRQIAELADAATLHAALTAQQHDLAMLPQRLLAQAFA